MVKTDCRLSSHAWLGFIVADWNRLVAEIAHLTATLNAQREVVEEQTTELNDLDMKLGAALRALGQRYTKRARLDATPGESQPASERA